MAMAAMARTCNIGSLGAREANCPGFRDWESCCDYVELL